MGQELSAAVVGFIEGGVSVVAASHDGDNRPVLGRGLGVRVAADRRRLTVFLGAEACAPLLGAIAEHGAVAVVFTQPTTHRSLQLKGRDAAVAPADPAELPGIRAHLAAFADELRAIGFPEPFVHTFTAPEAGRVSAVTFTAEAAFDQTPGPRAGDVLAP